MKQLEHSLLDGDGNKLRKALENFTFPFESVEVLGQGMRRLMELGFTDIPLPGHGSTLLRWRRLADIAGIDLSLAKIYEGHTDALAILAELGGQRSEGLWAVWAAEPPSARVTYRTDSGGASLHGRKAWCSGAAIVDEALVSAWDENGRPVLAQVRLRQPGVKIEEGWDAVGMSASQSVSVVFDGARAAGVGGAGAYVSRPGFWQGGAGIASVWYGGAVAVAKELANSSRVLSDPHAAAHLGAVDAALSSARSLLIDTAGWIDQNPDADACVPALRVRGCVESVANEVLLRVGRALGAAPLCINAEHAQRCADLTVFLRQSHAESDWAALGQAVASETSAWQL
jgi:alkylation response protein AidB-like acyl-CoA dehydrogenase